MRDFIHYDLIAEKLEIARTMGLVTDYRVSRPDAGVRVWRSASATDAGIREYLIRLLSGLVASDRIFISAPMAAIEPGAATESADRDIGGAPVPAAAAA
jgi:hypothetical protein